MPLVGFPSDQWPGPGPTVEIRRDCVDCVFSLQQKKDTEAIPPPPTTTTMGFLCCFGGRDAQAHHASCCAEQGAAAGSEKTASSTPSNNGGVKGKASAKPYTDTDGTSSGGSSPVSTRNSSLEVGLACADTLQKPPYQLCSPIQLIEGIENLTFLGQGAYACVYKGKCTSTTVHPYVRTVRSLSSCVLPQPSLEPSPVAPSSIILSYSARDSARDKKTADLASHASSQSHLTSSPLAIASNLPLLTALGTLVLLPIQCSCPSNRPVLLPPLPFPADPATPHPTQACGTLPRWRSSS